MLAQQATEADGMTLAEYRSAVQTRLAAAARTAAKSREKPAPPDLSSAERAFADLLLAQARQSAAQQSLDRLAGWSKAIQARFEAQNAPELDVQAIQFAEAHMAAASEHTEKQRRRAVAHANTFLGRPAASPLTALLPSSGDASSGGGNGGAHGELLDRGRELLNRMYRSYSFGGTSLAALLWQEQQVYQAELDYRTAIVTESVPASQGKE
jgi:hypothetical protein